MNIFYLSNNTTECAKSHVNSHAVKMILEYSQLLSTAHRVLDGEQYIDSSSGRKIKRAEADDKGVGTTEQIGSYQGESSVLAKIEQNFYGVFGSFGDVFQPVPTHNQANARCSCINDQKRDNQLHQDHMKEKIVHRHYKKKAHTFDRSD